ncbi:MAG: fructose-6-phosphate aldolase [candidate division WOR-3 bacterium]|uniref:Fructose-6-phosphate aldolase n=1 Tax=candidate division WOR-3 bacterium TaxID=2052148 RepID=A0A7C3EFY4_UNCW3|nr:fructose-6-phosphate aldolase [candidate division WOR-3 bacterium]
MKIFIDSADIREIQEVAGWGILDGVTTNPTLVRKAGKPFRECVAEILRVVDGPVSVEAISPDADGMVREAEEWARLDPAKVTIKIPMGIEGLKAVRELARRQIMTNVTLVFSPNQALLACRAGATFISPFIGRLDDISHDGMELVRDIVGMIEYYDFATQVIAASIRHPLHVIEAMRAGAHIATIPYDVLKKMVQHPLTDAGIRKFYEDYQQIPKGKEG